MPYPTFVRFWLDPKTRGAADDFGAQLTGFLEAQHHDDGTHGDITADSIVVSGDVEIGGDLTLDGDIAADNIACISLQVAGSASVTTTIYGVQFGSHQVNLGNSGILSVGVAPQQLSESAGGVGLLTLRGDGSASLAVLRNNAASTSTNPTANLVNENTTNNSWAEHVFSTLDDGGPPSEVIAARYGAQITSHTAGSVTADHVWKGSTNNELMRLTSAGLLSVADLSVTDDLNVVDDFSVNTSKFTVDGATGDTVIAGTITAAGLPTVAGAANTLWVDTTGGFNIVKRV